MFTLDKNLIQLDMYGNCHAQKMLYSIFLLSCWHVGDPTAHSGILGLNF